MDPKIKPRLRRTKNRNDPSFPEKISDDNKDVIEQDIGQNKQVQLVQEPKPVSDKKKSRFNFGQNKEDPPKTESSHEIPVRSRNALERTAYNLLSSHLPGFEELRETYSQSGIPLIFEAVHFYRISAEPSRNNSHLCDLPNLGNSSVPPRSHSLFRSWQRDSVRSSVWAYSSLVALLPHAEKKVEQIQSWRRNLHIPSEFWECLLPLALT